MSRLATEDNGREGEVRAVPSQDNGSLVLSTDLTAATADDQGDPDRRRHNFDRLDRNSAGAEDRIDPAAS
jgi:hypothetical protein